jgi:lysophospholipase L1-like esterase
MRQGAAVAVCFFAAAFAAGFGVGYGARVWQGRVAESAPILARSADPARSYGYRHRVDHFARLPDGPRVVMLGDSLTANAQWTELLGTAVANRGVPGDTASGVLARLDQSMPGSAATVFLMVGINDLKDTHATPVAVAATIARIVRRLAPRRVYLQSVLYVRIPGVNDEVKRLNALNRAFCETGACTYVELNTVEAPGGVLAPAASLDGLHLNGEGYERWARVIRPLLPVTAAAEAVGR